MIPGQASTEGGVMQLDMIVSVRFLANAGGGRSGDLMGSVYSCPLNMAGPTLREAGAC